MGMRYNDFWYNYTLRELWNAVDGFLKREEIRTRENWEQARIIYTGIANQHARSAKKPESLIPFPWDNEGELPEEDVLAELKKEMDKKNKEIRDGNKDSS
jgi:hypothetical protein